jgi:hypothetical protein
VPRCRLAATGVADQQRRQAALLGIALQSENVGDCGRIRMPGFVFYRFAAQQPRRVAQDREHDHMIPGLSRPPEQGYAEFMEQPRREPARRFVDRGEVSSRDFPRVGGFGVNHGRLERCRHDFGTMTVRLQ